MFVLFFAVLCSPHVFPSPLRNLVSQPWHIIASWLVTLMTDCNIREAKVFAAILRITAYLMCFHKYIFFCSWRLQRKSWKQDYKIALCSRPWNFIKATELPPFVGKCLKCTKDWHNQTDEKASIRTEQVFSSKYLKEHFPLSTHWGHKEVLVKGN